MGGIAPLIVVIVVVVTLLAVLAAERISTARRRAADPEGKFAASRRRAVGGTLLVLEEFIAPRVEHVIEARQEQRHEDEEAGGDDGLPNETQLRADLAAGLAADPLDPEEIRRHLAAAGRAGLDWRRLFDEAAAAELAARPYRAPSLPPIGRVAPREA